MPTFTLRIIVNFARVLLLISAVSFTAKADSPLNLEQLRTLFKPYESVSELQVSFQQRKTISGLKKPLLSEGELRLQKPDFVQWTVLKPSFLRIEMQKKQMRLETGSDPKNKRTQVLSESETGSLTSLVAWMRMDAGLLAEQYQVTSLGSRRYAFVPKNPASFPMEKMEIEMGAQDFLKTLTLFEKSGDRIEITFATPQVKRTK